MKQIKVGSNEAGQRLDKLLLKLLNKAGKSFIYKMLRKKNIVLNGKKATGSEKLSIGDEIKIFLSDETYNKFSQEVNYSENVKDSNKIKLDIIYEDENIMFINKPVGILSQKDTKDSISLVEYIIDYMLSNNKISKEQLKSFRPSVVNRLDRNTSGLIVAGKSLLGLQTMSEYIKNKTVDKYYIAIVKGLLSKNEMLYGSLKKDTKTNKVSISSRQDKASVNIKTEYEVLSYNDKYTLLKVKLITGKTHQIRAHLASINHAIVGDYKYGDRKINDYLKKKYNISCQLLHSYQMNFPLIKDDPMGVSNKTIIAPLSKEFQNVISDFFGKDCLKQFLV